MFSGFWGLQPSLRITALCESEICTQSKQPRRLTRVGFLIHRQTVCLYSHSSCPLPPQVSTFKSLCPPVIISFYLIQLAFPPTLGGNSGYFKKFFVVWKVRFVALIPRKVIHPLDPLPQIRTSLGSVFKVIALLSVIGVPTNPAQLLIIVFCVGHVTGAGGGRDNGSEGIRNSLKGKQGGARQRQAKAMLCGASVFYCCHVAQNFKGE